MDRKLTFFDPDGNDADNDEKASNDTQFVLDRATLERCLVDDAADGIDELKAQYTSSEDQTFKRNMAEMIITSAEYNMSGTDSQEVYSPFWNLLDSIEGPDLIAQMLEDFPTLFSRLTADFLEYNYECEEDAKMYSVREMYNKVKNAAPNLKLPELPAATNNNSLTS